MAGPHTPQHGLAADGPPYTDPHPSQPDRPEALSAGYPGQLPPPVPYPQRHRSKLVIGAVVALLLIVAMTLAVGYGSQQSRSSTATKFSDATAKTTIQDYLNALENRDTDTIARNLLCGIYDAVRDRHSDQALARLSSDAFRKQFAQAEVTSIDKIVYLSDYQTQVLFTMRVKTALGGAGRGQVQGLAQLLLQHGQALVCSYVLRTAGAY